jgi:hypothetical protein
VNPGQALRQVQLDGHAKLDAIYGPLAAAIAAAILGWFGKGDDGAATLTAAGRIGVRRDVARLLVAAEPDLAQAIGESIERARLAADGVVNGAVDGRLVSISASGIRLYLARDTTRVAAQTLGRIDLSIGAGRTPATIAEYIKQYFSPFFAPRRDVAGTIKRADRVGAVRSWPGQAGMASSGPRTVMLTETGRTHAQATLKLARDNGEYVRWRLSPKHKDADECDANSRRDIGFGPGVYQAFPLDAAPKVPAHVRCRCYLERVRRPTI